MIRNRLCSKASCDLAKSCLCRVDHETTARDVIKLLLSEPDHPGTRRSSQPSLRCDSIGLCHSPATESFVIRSLRGDSLLHQMGIDMAAQKDTKEQRNATVELNKPTTVQLSIVLLKLREQLPLFFNGHHEFTLYSANIQFEYSIGNQSPLVMVGKQRYKLAIESFRHATCCMWTSPKLEVLKITKVVDSGTIECRWRVSGHLRGTFGRGKERVLYDAFSIFTIDHDGLICKHKLQKVMPHPTTVKARTSWWDFLLTRITARTTN